MLELNMPYQSNGYTFFVSDTAESVPGFRDHIWGQFGDQGILNEKMIMSDQEKARRKDLKIPLESHIKRFLFIYSHGEFVGWISGSQKNEDTFEMINSAILPAWRRKGLYTAALKLFVDHVAGLGFQKVTSRHHPNNNGVIIPKLKHGFIVTGLEMSEIYGLLLHLTWFKSSKRAEFYAYRTGYVRPNDEILSHLREK